MYPVFKVEGVPDGSIWQLFNVSNFEYYCRKVEDLKKGVCPFCSIDPEINKIIPDVSNESWNVWINSIAPKSEEGAQQYQFVIPSVRHVECLDDLNACEWSDLGSAVRRVNQKFGLKGGVLLARSGDPALNAKSVPHMHFNYHVPTGDKCVSVTIAKSEDKLRRKLPVLRTFEKMRGLRNSGVSDKDIKSHLTPGEWLRVEKKLGKKKS